jgi:hypothetical protein
MSEILSHFPQNLQEVIQKIDGIVQTHTDSLAVCVLSGLASLGGGATVSLVGGGGRPIILFCAAFAQSGTGKSAGANAVRKYLLKWQETNFQKMDKKANSENIPDVFLEVASAEGLEASLSLGSTPFVFLDELGLLIKMSKNDVVKQALLKALMSIFDSGSFVTRRLKEQKRAALLQAKGLGLFAASTLGVANLSNDDIRDMVSNGALNRFLITFGGIKPIPLKDELTTTEAAEVEAFAKQFAKTAKDKKYKFGEPSKDFYQDYHKKINEIYMDKLYNQDDGAGLVVRQLTFLQRIACIFQICLDFENSKNNEISLEAVEAAAGLLDYLDRVHFEQISLYIRSKSGKISPSERVLDKISKKPGINQRDLTTSLSYVLKSEQIRTAIDLLLSSKKIQQLENGYFKA